MPNELQFLRMFFLTSYRPFFLIVETFSQSARRKSGNTRHLLYYLSEKKDENCIFIQNKKLKFAVQLNIYT